MMAAYRSLMKILKSTGANVRFSVTHSRCERSTHDHLFQASVGLVEPRFLVPYRTVVLGLT